RLSPIRRTLRAFATITSCPNSLSKRLIQGEWVPISSAIRLRGMAPNTSRKAFAVVRTRCSSCMWPASSNTQYQLLRSPRSNPIVNFCCTEKFLLCCVAAVLLFFIAVLFFICASSTSITWERTPHPVRRPAFSSHLFDPVPHHSTDIIELFNVTRVILNTFECNSRLLMVIDPARAGDEALI